MKIPSFIGLLIMALGLAAIYIGIMDWYPRKPLVLTTIKTGANDGAGAPSGGGGGGFG